MSYVNLPPEPTFVKLERVIRDQKRLMLTTLIATTMFIGTFFASVISML
jgi:hypothetical protein